MKNTIILISILCTCLLYSQEKEVNFNLTQLTPSIYMLEGQGGNIGIYANEKGIFIIDDQFARLSKDILEQIKTISNQPVTMVINTHFHGDHTGGNQNMAEQGATIFAHQNVRKRMIDRQKEKGNVNRNSLPVITFNEGLQIYFEKDEINAFHVHNAHTDGDALIYFSKANVLHTGDTFFNGKYPYIDLKSGGSIKGYMDAAQKALILADENTKIIPGHGKLGSRKDLELFLTMLKDITAKIQNAIQSKQSKDSIIADSSITKKYDLLGYGDGSINSERIRKTIYTSLTKDLK